MKRNRLWGQALAWGLALCLALAACGSVGEAPAPAESAPDPQPAAAPPPAWWEAADWTAPDRSLSAGGITAETYGDTRARVALTDPLPADDAAVTLSLYTGEGRVRTVSGTAGGENWTGAAEIAARKEDRGLVLMLRDDGLAAESLTALKTTVTAGETKTETFYPVAEDGTLGAEGPSLPDLSDQAARFRYLLTESGEDRVMLALYGGGEFLLTRRAAGQDETDTLLWGSWDDGNTAITLWPDPQCCGPDTVFRLAKTGGLRVYDGEGPESLPLSAGDAFQKVGDLLDLPAFDAAVVSMVVNGDRPAIFLDRQEDEALLDAFREMMADAAELKYPRWTEDPEDRPNIQFDLNLNGENVTMVLCPCIVDGTTDKYLLVEKSSWMGRVTYTYYQTQTGDDYDRMVALFDARYETEPQTLTAAMAAQIRAQTAAISHLDWSDEFPLDQNGVPVKYKAVLREQRATGYSGMGRTVYGAGSRTSQAKTGVYYCTAGTVAVRPEQIPYGTKLYIRTSGGNFIYGYAVANDTGTGLMDGVIDVDLFYDTYEESKLNSVRWVDIYILE